MNSAAASPATLLAAPLTAPRRKGGVAGATVVAVGVVRLGSRERMMRKVCQRAREVRCYRRGATTVADLYCRAVRALWLGRGVGVFQR